MGDIVLGSIMGFTVLVLSIITIICTIYYFNIKNMKGIRNIKIYHLLSLFLISITAVYVLILLILLTGDNILEKKEKAVTLIILSMLRILTSVIFFINYFVYLRPILKNNLSNLKVSKNLKGLRNFYIFTTIFSFLTGIGPLISGIKLLKSKDAKDVQDVQQNRLAYLLTSF